MQNADDPPGRVPRMRNTEYKIQGIKFTLHSQLFIKLFWISGFCLCFAACQFSPPTMQAVHIVSPPHIDGFLDDNAWRQAAHIPLFPLTDGTGFPSERTEVFVAADSTHLYVAFICYETMMDSLRMMATTHDGQIWGDDRIEIFIDVNGDRLTYHHFAVTAGGTMFDGIGRGGGNTWDGPWEAVVSRGTVSWTAEIALPIGPLLVNSHPIRDMWHIAFARYEARKKEMSAWSPTLSATFHVPERFGTITDLPFDFDRYAMSIHPVLPEHPFFGKNEVVVDVVARGQMDRHLSLQLTATDPTGRATKVVSATRIDAGRVEAVSFYVPTEQEGEERITVEVSDLRDGEVIYRSPSLRLIVPPSIDLSLDRSYYSGETSARCQFMINLHPDLRSEGSKRLEVVDIRGRVVMVFPVEETVVFPLTQMGDGAYRLIGYLLDKDGKSLAKVEQWLIINRTIGHTPGRREVKIDGLTNTLIVNGGPFFPVGIYWTREAYVRDLANMAFNTGDYYPWLTEEEIALLMDRAAAQQFGILLEFSDLLRPVGSFDREKVRERVERYRNHPGLLAWYLIDEPGETQTSVEETGEAYRFIKELDPTHPVYLVNNRPETYADYALAADILAIDPYPIPNRSPSAVADAVDLAIAAVRERKPVWVIIQAFGATEWWARAPTPAEERCMVYLALIHGAKGILFYRYCTVEERTIQSEELWNEVVQLARELHELGPILLTGEEVRGVRVEPEKSEIDILTKWFEDDIYLFAVNRSDRSYEVEFILPDGRYVDGVTLYGRERRFHMTGGGFKDRFEGYGVRVYRLKKERA